MDRLARTGTTDVCNIVDHQRFTIHPLVKNHIATDHNTHTIGRTDGAAATVIAGLESYYANDRRSNNRRRERSEQTPPRTQKRRTSPLRGGAAATNVIDKKQERQKTAHIRRS